MKQQKLNGELDRLLVCVPKKVGFKVRHLAGNRHTSISSVACGFIKDGLRREGFLKDGE